jgi:hypothetical protein
MSLAQTILLAGILVGFTPGLACSCAIAAAG